MSAAATQEVPTQNEARPKKPFHETISRMLMTAPVGITTDLRDAKAAEVATLLGVLEASKMPASAAHQIADDHKDLPNLLSSVGQKHLANFATEVLMDLRGREDEKKDE